MIKPTAEDCPCCRYHYGSYLPRHCPDKKKPCSWFQCKECGAVCLPDGSSHFNDKPHACTEQEVT